MAPTAPSPEYATKSKMGRSSPPSPADVHGSLPQSRELGDVIPETSGGAITMADRRPSPFAKSWVHFLAGGIGGMTAATVTAPLDVLKTRLQSDFYQRQLRLALEAHTRAAGGRRMGPVRASAYHLADTFSILRALRQQEGWRALFKGLGPNLVGIVPARAINFYVYGNGKQLVALHANAGRESAWVHMAAGVLAGVVTSAATNPVWLVKTRLQLDKNVAARSGGAVQRRYRNSWDCVRQVLRHEGLAGMYKGLSASLLGVGESTLQWVLYEQLKASLRARERRVVESGRDRTLWDRAVDVAGQPVAAGAAKLVAAVGWYPHEVVRTRLRQAPMADGQLKYTGLVQCFRLLGKEEGLMGLYGGLTPHLLRTVPSAIIMFGMYEGILRLFHTES